MMKMIKILVLTLFSVLSCAVYAAGATKVAILDVETLVLASETGKSAMAQLEKNPEYAALKTKLDNFEAEQKTLEEQAKTQGLTWGESKQKEHREKLIELSNDRREAVSMLSRGREVVYMQLLKALEPGIAHVLNNVMVAEGIELVLDSKTVIHGVPTADITPMVLDRLNKLNNEAAANAKKNEQSKKPAANTNTKKN